MANRKQSDDEKLRGLIAKAGLTGRAFARRIGYGERMIRYMLTGEKDIEPVVMLAAEHLALCECTRAEREEREGRRSVNRLADIQTG